MLGARDSGRQGPAHSHGWHSRHPQARRTAVLGGFYRTCVIDGVLQHSPAEYVRRPNVPAESPTLELSHLQFEALLFAGVSNQEFSSTLQRIPYPFTGAANETQLEIYHLAHGQYETRAPIRAMQFATIDGEDTLIAAYACSPLVTIAVSALKPARR